jgi:hypothetical protein
VARAVDAGRLPGLASVRAGWLAVADRYGRKGPPSEAVWLDGARAWLVDAVDAWLNHIEREDPKGTANRGAALVWWESPVVGELMAELGLPMYGAGSDQPIMPAAPVDGIREGLPGDATPAVSRRVHGEGANLQAWSRCLVLQPLPNGLKNEQLIGRIHRPGQHAGLCRVDWFAAAWPARRAVEVAIAKSHFLEDMQLTGGSGGAAEGGAGAGGAGADGAARSAVKMLAADWEAPLILGI